MTIKHEVMLAPSANADVTNLEFPALIQPKYDGYRATYIPNLGFISRTGKIFRNKNIMKYFASVEDIQDTVLDGELYVPNQNFQELASIINTEDAVIDKPLQFIIFDAIPIQDWNDRKCSLKYSERLTLLRKITNYINDRPKILDVPTDIVNNSAELVVIYKELLTKGLEGAMIKKSYGLYKWGRIGSGKEVLKLKPFKSMDLIVTGVYEGQGRLENTIGGLICDYNGSELRVGTGFTIEERDSIRDNLTFYIGKTVEIKYLEKTKNEKSLRHPVFARWREDK